MAFTNILITGASSGIGAALARAYAREGVRLFLWGRDTVRLDAVASAARTRGAFVETRIFDITDFSLLNVVLESLDGEYPLDLVLLNAGLGGSLAPDRVGQEPHAAEKMAGVNFTAPILTANLTSDHMARRGKGQIVLIGSVAASFPLPMAPLYSASKAGLAMYAEALGLRLKRYGVGVTLVSPGFIDTPMSQSLNEPRPFLISADKAAAIIMRKVTRGARHIILPWQFSVILAVSKSVPGFILRAILTAF